MIKAMVLDDELEGQDILCLLLQKYCPDVEVVERLYSVKEAMQALERQPEVKLLFLDVQLGSTSGFDVLNGIDKRTFEVIFITAYDKYAIKAIKFDAADYIMKPIDFNELVTAVGRVRQRLVSTDSPTAPRQEKLKVQTGDRIMYINITDILWLNARGNYTEIHTSGNKKYLVAKTLGEFEEKLAEITGEFVRTNRNAVVCRQAVKSLGKGADAFIELHDGTVLPISRRRRTEVMEKIKSI